MTEDTCSYSTCLPTRFHRAGWSLAGCYSRGVWITTKISKMIIPEIWDKYSTTKLSNVLLWCSVYSLPEPFLKTHGILFHRERERERRSTWMNERSRAATCLHIHMKEMSITCKIRRQNLKEMPKRELCDVLKGQAPFRSIAHLIWILIKWSFSLFQQSRLALPMWHKNTCNPDHSAIFEKYSIAI